MINNFSNNSNKYDALKKQDAFIEVIFIDPITLPFAKFFSSLEFHPISFTIIAFFARVFSAVLFLKGIFITGAILAFLGMFFDGLDGKIARIRKKDERLHGVSDFLLDQVSVGLMILGLLYWGMKNYLFEISFLLSLWIVLRTVLMSTVSTWFRILSQEGTVYTEKTGENFFIEVSTKDQRFSSSIFGKMGHLFVFMSERLKKYRIIPYFGAVEFEFVLFILAPFFGMNITLIVLAIILLFPDISIKLFQIFLRTIYSNRLK